MKAAAAIVFAAVLVEHFAYYLITPDPVGRTVWFYVLGGFTGAVVYGLSGISLARLLASVDALTVWSRLLVVGCLWMAVEDLQVGLCGLESYGIVSRDSFSGLCSDRWGDAPYRVILYVGGIALAVFAIWQQPHARTK